jgi:hypothetical protein
MKEKSFSVCAICNETISNLFLSRHIEKKHNITVEEYYIKYIDGENKNKCECGKDTEFVGLFFGYRRYCSRECVNKSKDRAERILKGRIANGTHELAYVKQKETNNNKTPEEKAIYKKNLLEGIRNAHKNDPDIWKRVYATKLEKYGKEEIGKQISRKRKKTNEAEQIITEKRKNTCLEKYGVIHVMHKKEFADKVMTSLTPEQRIANGKRAMQTRISNGELLPLDHPDRKKMKYYKQAVKSQSYTVAKQIYGDEWIKNRGLNGTNNAIQLDHIVSVSYGYKNNIPIEIISHPCNLRLIKWEENISKFDKNGMTLDELLILIANYKE